MSNIHHNLPGIPENKITCDRERDRERERERANLQNPHVLALSVLNY
jgi:hypothetical protein